jgi:hypothetical protein
VEIDMGKIIDWFKFRLTDKFTVAHDLSPFSHPFNRREELDHFKGLWRAKLFCYRWVLRHPMGQARILQGWLDWPEESKTDIDGLDPMDGTAGYADSK